MDRNDPQMVRDAIRYCHFGKQTQGAFYVHKSSKRKLHGSLLLVLQSAQEINAKVPQGSPKRRAFSAYDVIKFALDGSQVSFLRYPGFFEIRNPILTQAVTISITKGTVKATDYGQRRNPPILHRKEQMLHVDHPEYARLSQQTLVDEREGLLGRSDIGTLYGWVKAQLVAGGVHV